MIEVISLVNFDNPERARYLERSFGSFYRYYSPDSVKHWVLDSSRALDTQSPYYKQYGIQVVHVPGLSYGDRLKRAADLVTESHFLFLPDDFQWIFNFPFKEAIMASEHSGIAELKLTCRGMPWFAQPGAPPEPWFHHENGRVRVMSGELLACEGNMHVSRRRWIRNFHEQFSLACNLFESDFARWVFRRISSRARSPGEAEKQAYVRLLIKRYATGYYKMWIPAFHFIDLKVEGDRNKNKEKAATMLVEANFETYNKHYNI
ncbi:MAG: hypothetical protein AB7G93_05490 [Bdellovibrionales bacterium]